MDKHSDEKKFRLFENDITLTGKHATYLKFLVNDAQLYQDYIDVYMNAVVFGYLYNVKSDKDNGTQDRARIYADAFSNHRDECISLYRIITLLDNKSLSQEECLNKSFRYDSDPQKYDEVRASMEKFNSYVRGGIEYMYNQFTTGCTSKEDYVRQSFTVSKRFMDGLGETDYANKINELLNK